MVRHAIPDELFSALVDETETLAIPSGLRFATQHLSTARAATEGPMLDIARSVLGPGTRMVRSILFDKSAASNWLVPWHQDLSIATVARHEVPGYGPWSVKDDTPHVQPPREVLESIVTLRLHLDPTPAANGALKVLPRSHARGIIPMSEIPACRQALPEVTLEANPNDLLLMRPLLLHASSKSTLPNARRRVLHVEYSNIELPLPLHWAEN